ncbi:putative F-box/LRR-repeat protein At3g28410 [Jatropha curcas]|uniref:putative F-box/LRR-repeat protein At3g28410 n=1 Tax=Jatropha curcas TaxID=180498 RepID=UPI0018952FB5|nr:putative F-box/LRR-repeat protein At3g28410 [Jatropha curcas]
MEVNSSVHSTKLRKVNEEGNIYSNGIDDLPEPILVHILSFLPAKDAVKTSILSKKWEYLWRSVTNLRFHDIFDFFYPISYVLPSSLFMSDSLTELKVGMFEDLKLPSYICFSSLKILTLKYVTFLDAQSMHQLFSGCLVLEKLTLDECAWIILWLLVLKFPRLKPC